MEGLAAEVWISDGDSYFAHLPLWAGEGRYTKCGIILGQRVIVGTEEGKPPCRNCVEGIRIS